MATLYISEFAHVTESIGRGAGSTINQVRLPGYDQTVAIAAGANSSKAFNASTKAIRVIADVACSIQVSRGVPAATGVAAVTATNMRLAPNVPELFGVHPLSVLQVITNT